jgi:hypothetical protein
MERQGEASRLVLDKVTTKAFLRSFPHRLDDSYYRFLAILMRRYGMISFDEISEELWPNFDNMPLCWKNVLWVYVYYLRREGWEIVNHPGRGYELIGRNRK